MDKLKPCYCGNDHVYLSKGQIFCSTCPIIFSSGRLTEQDLVEAWNTRQGIVVPDTHVSVPVEPTMAIRDAHYTEMKSQGFKTMDIASIDEVALYKAMIAASEDKEAG